MAKRGRPRVDKKKKRQRVKVQFIERLHAGKVVECYAIAEKIIKDCRADLKDVKIGFAWGLGWRPNADRILQLGKCTKRNDLDRELDAYDFIIILNKDAWPTLEARHKERLIYHQLEHAQLTRDNNGEPKKNDRGRFVCRIKKHDFEEFQSVIKKYGLSDDLSKLAQAGIHDAERPLLQGPAQAGTKTMAAAVAASEAERDAAQKKNKKPQRKVRDLNQ